MTPTPRKVRSGRRQFGPSPGTDQEWAKVMASPHVQRAFQDPNIQQVLMQHMQQQAAAAGPADAGPAAPVGMAEGGVLQHFDSGGLNAAEINDLVRQINELPEGEKKNQLRMRLATAQAQSAPGALAIPGGGTASANTMGGVSQMVKPPTLGNTALAAGMSGLLSAGATSHQGMSALLGAGLGGALSYLIRKYGKNAQKPGSGTGGGGGGYQQPPDTTSGTSSTGSTEVQPAEAWKNQPAPSVAVPSSGPTGGPESVPGLSNVGALPSPPPSSGASLKYGTANSPSGNVISRDGGKTWIDTKTNKPYTDGPVVNSSDIGSSSLNSAAPATTPSPQGSADTAAPPPPATAGTAAHPGMDFMAQQQKRLEHGLIRRGPADQKSEDAAPLSTPDLANLPMQGTNVLDPYYGGGLGLAGGGPVPEGPPSGLRSALAPMPVLHIVIAGKPKKTDEKPGKKAGGKAQLLPPKRGPQDHEDRPRTHGRVQVPRGSGAAIKGKRFGGIY